MTAGRNQHLVVVSLAAALLMGSAAGAAAQDTSRIKDLASLDGMTPEPLLGYGLVVGLGGTGDLQAEISVQIKEVLPNGYFRLVGTRLVEINGDRQLIEISGCCRPQDIRADNTILSTYIADAQIAYSGTGALNDVAQPGIITRIVNWLF